jgi:hypothetical protein
MQPHRLDFNTIEFDFGKEFIEIGLALIVISPTYSQWDIVFASNGICSGNGPQSVTQPTIGHQYYLRTHKVIYVEFIY